MSFGGRFRESLDTLEECLRKIEKYERPYRNSIVHFDNTVILKQLKRINRLIRKRVEEIECDLKEERLSVSGKGKAVKK